MTHQLTQNIEVTVKPQYEHSEAVKGCMVHMFSYHITIKNLSEYTIQLKRRHWYIFDSIGDWKEVEGEGVVGFQPIIEPEGIYQYESGCHLISGIGSMYGSYQIEKKYDGEKFEIDIPYFRLEAPFLLN